MIMQRLKFRKTFNQERDKNSKSQAFVTEHLPNELYQQKKKILSLYKEAWCNKKQATRLINNGKYCLFIEGKRALLRVKEQTAFAITQLRDGILSRCSFVLLM